MDAGEVSLMVMGGQFTHAVMKKAKEGDYRTGRFLAEPCITLNRTTLLLHLLNRSWLHAT